MDIWKQSEVSINMTSSGNRKMKIGKPVFNRERTDIPVRVCRWGLSLPSPVLECHVDSSIDIRVEVPGVKFYSSLTAVTVQKCSLGSHHRKCPRQELNNHFTMSPKRRVHLGWRVPQPSPSASFSLKDVSPDPSDS